MQQTVYKSRCFITESNQISNTH